MYNGTYMTVSTEFVLEAASGASLTSSARITQRTTLRKVTGDINIKLTLVAISISYVSNLARQCNDTRFAQFYVALRLHIGFGCIVLAFTPGGSIRARVNGRANDPGRSEIRAGIHSPYI